MLAQVLDAANEIWDVYETQRIMLMEEEELEERQRKELMQSQVSKCFVHLALHVTRILYRNVPMFEEGARTSSHLSYLHLHRSCIHQLFLNINLCLRCPFL